VRRLQKTVVWLSGWKLLLDGLYMELRTDRQLSCHWSQDTPPHHRNRQKRAAVAFLDKINVSMSLYVGFIMDRFTSLTNITQTKPHLQLELIPFNFRCDQSPVTFYPTVNTLIKIKVILPRDAIIARYML